MPDETFPRLLAAPSMLAHMPILLMDMNASVISVSPLQDPQIGGARSESGKGRTAKTQGKIERSRLLVGRTESARLASGWSKRPGRRRGPFALKGPAGFADNRW